VLKHKAGPSVERGGRFPGRARGDASERRGESRRVGLRGSSEAGAILPDRGKEFWFEEKVLAQKGERENNYLSRKKTPSPPGEGEVL